MKLILQTPTEFSSSLSLLTVSICFLLFNLKGNIWLAVEYFPLFSDILLKQIIS